jgi:hypothetical protein
MRILVSVLSVFDLQIFVCLLKALDASAVISIMTSLLRVNLLPRYMKFSTFLICLPFRLIESGELLKSIIFVFGEFICTHI